MCEMLQSRLLGLVHKFHGFRETTDRCVDEMQCFVGAKQKLWRHAGAGVVVMLIYRHVRVAALAWGVQMWLVTATCARFVYPSDEIRKAPNIVWRRSQGSDTKLTVGHCRSPEVPVDRLVASWGSSHQEHGERYTRANLLVVHSGP